MRMKDALAVYGTKKSIAKALGLSRASISYWGDEVPILRQYQLAALTAGRLTITPRLRVDIPQRKSKSTKAHPTSREGRLELLEKRAEAREAKRAKKAEASS